MYFKLKYAKTNFMILAIFLISLLLILPIFISVYLYFDVIDKRLYFAIYLFSIIKVKTGYVVKRKYGGFYIHTSKKAYVFDKNSLKNLKMSKLELTKSIASKSLDVYIDIGVKNANFLLGSVALFYTAQNIALAYKNIHNYFNFHFDLNVFDKDKTLISIKLKYLFSFNIFGILINLIANLISKGVKNAKKYAKT